MRSDVNIAADVGVREVVVSTLLDSYKPTWLRLGLEVVYAQAIPLANYENVRCVLKTLDD